jgi:crotonobetainyl-CoA:carnitine CoA-transferase CaiB-like acyl-CoA transferase
MTALPLSGIQVLDVSIAVQGPQACQMLHDLGADVIKVEMPGVGDINRSMTLSPNDLRSSFFYAINRGKRSITLDLRTKTGKKVLLRLVENAHVMVSNFKPGTLETWGLGYDTIKTVNPKIVFAAGSTFGHLGPGAQAEGVDLSGQALGGLISTTGVDGGDVTPVGAAITDHEGAQNLTIGILAALRVAERDGIGQRVDVSLLGGQIWTQAAEYTNYFLRNVLPGRSNWGHPLLASVYRIFKTSDGWLAICGVTTPLRPGFWRALDRPDLANEPRFQTDFYADLQDRRDLYAILEKVFATRTTAEWCERLKAERQRFAPVRTYAEAAEDPQMFENGYIYEIDHPEHGRIKVVGNPIMFSETPARRSSISPKLGEHTGEILRELGLEEVKLG